MLYAPEIQEFEVSTRLDQKTRSVIMERHQDYPGQDKAPVAGKPSDLYRWLQHAGELDSEHIFVVLMDEDRRIVGWTAPHGGQLGSVEASTRRMIREALLSNSSLLAICHNHPSGDPAPSKDDKNLTKVTAKCARHLGLKLIDHIIVGQKGQKSQSKIAGGKGYYSFYEAGDKQVDNDDDSSISLPEHDTSHGLVDDLTDQKTDCYQFATRFHAPTHSIVMERDSEFDYLSPAGPLIDEPQKIATLFAKFSESSEDLVIVGALNVRNEIIGWTALELDEEHQEISGYPVGELKNIIRPIMRDVMFANGYTFFVATRHAEDSNPKPDVIERKFTDFLVEVSSDLGMGFFDHAIIAQDHGRKVSYYSFRENGEIPDDEEQDEQEEGT